MQERTDAEILRVFISSLKITQHFHEFLKVSCFSPFLFFFLLRLFHCEVIYFGMKVSLVFIGQFQNNFQILKTLKDP